MNDEPLNLAAKESGTRTKKNTAHAALEFGGDRLRLIGHLLDAPCALGVGPDIADRDVMRQARR